MPTATQTPTTLTRRSAIGFSLSAFAAGLTVPVLASASLTEGVASTDTLGADAELIALCDQFLTNETELWLLTDHDDYAADFGPNRTHYDRLDAERIRLKKLVDECHRPVSAAGTVAIARVALTWVERDTEGAAVCEHWGEEMMLKLAEAVSAGFVWPPRGGSCSTVRWAPPPSPREVAEYSAAAKARWAAVDAKIQADKEIAEAEQLRKDTPSTMTDDELRRRAPATREIRNIAAKIAGQLDAEMARRGLVA
jgi:hypothetical protein